MTKEEARLTLQENLGYLTSVHHQRITDAIKVAIEALSKPVLPSNLDKAAEEIVKDWNAYGDGEYKKLVIAGAEWMAGQGETFNGFMSVGGKRSLVAIEGSPQNFKFGEDVIVQIRKKEE